MVIFVEASFEDWVSVFEELCESMEAGTTLETTEETIDRSTGGCQYFVIGRNRRRAHSFLVALPVSAHKLSPFHNHSNANIFCYGSTSRISMLYSVRSVHPSYHYSPPSHHSIPGTTLRAVNSVSSVLSRIVVLLPLIPLLPASGDYPTHFHTSSLESPFAGPSVSNTRNTSTPLQRLELPLSVGLAQQHGR